MNPVSFPPEIRRHRSPIRALGVILFFLLLLLAPLLRAEQFGNLTYEIVGESVTITNYTGTGGEVTIPALISGRPVTAIGTNAFYELGLTSITIPDGVTSIGHSAFSGCSGLTSLTIPTGVTAINGSTFFGCYGLTSIVIPDGVTVIGDSAFSGCYGLTSVTIPTGVTAIGRSAFSGCYGLTSVTIPHGVTSIGQSAFDRCSGLTSIALPNSITSALDAFNLCSALTSVIIPNGVTTVGGFSGCSSLTSVIIPTGVTRLGFGAFSGCSSLTTVTIPEGVTVIGDSAFSGCYGLTSVTIPTGVTAIGKSAFSGCYGLTSVTIPNSVAAIPSGAFYGCTGLTSVTIPNSVTRIGSAFSGCSALTRVFFSGNAPIDTFPAAFPVENKNFTYFSFMENSGFNFPTWNGAPSIRISLSDQPFAVLRDNISQPRETTLQYLSAFQSGSSTFSILNTSDSPRNFTVSISGDNAGRFLMSPAPFSGTVAPWNTATFQITYRPGPEGNASATIDITDHGPDPQSRRFELRGQPLNQSAYLKASNTRASDAFGEAVAVSGNTAVSAALGGGRPGAVYVFVKSHTGWSQQAILTASNADPGDQFGISVAIDGDTIVVGAPYEESSAKGVNGNQSDDSAIESGAAYVFRRNGTAWSQQAYLKASNASSHNNFGTSVSIQGDLIAVGATGEDSLAKGINSSQSQNGRDANCGAVYIFNRTENLWNQSSYLKASNTDLGDWFGSAVAISANTLAVGARGKENSVTGNRPDNYYSSAGAAYVFTQANGIWSQQAYLRPSGLEGINFGRRLAISGDSLLIGSSGSFASPFIYHRVNSEWRKQAIIHPPVPNPQTALFGRAVAISGDLAVVSARLDSGSLDSAYLYQRFGDSWHPLTSLQPFKSQGDFFDRDSFDAVAVSGGTVMVGASTEDSAATGINGNQSDNRAYESGAAYIFENGIAPSAPTITVQPQSDGTVPAGTTVALEAEASGTPAPLFQWYRGSSGNISSPVQNANWRVFTTPHVTIATTYWMRATNAWGTADSAAVRLTPFLPTPGQWRLAHFGTADNAGPAADSEDPDGDGTSNLQEYTADTLPKDPADHFRITTAGHEGLGFRITVPGAFGRSYQLIRATDPTAAFWSPVAKAGPVQAVAPLVLTDPYRPAGRAFYRVIVSYP